MDCQTILVVADNKTITNLPYEGLNRPYQILNVPEGSRALELAEKGNVDLVLVSKYLPDMDGLEVVKSLKSRCAQLPVIMVSEAPTKESILSAFRAGANDFLELPLSEGQLMRSMNRVCARSSVKGKRTPEWQDVTLSPSRALMFFSNLFKGANNRSRSNRPSRSAGEAAQSSTSRRDHGTDANEGAAPQMQIHLLGKFHVILNQHVIEQWPSRKGKEIFAYLAYNHRRRVYRDILMDKFWPDSIPDSARNCLNVTLHGLRQQFHDIDPLHEHILFNDECYYLNPEIEIWLDVEEFLHYWRRGQSNESELGIEAALGEYELASAIYKGDFMEEEIYESWPYLDRENLKEIHMVILDRLSKHYSLDGKPQTAINLCQTILEKDNCREDVHRRLMRCYYRVGQRSIAIKQFQKCAEILKTQLEVEPMQATVDLLEQIKQDCLKTRIVKYL